MIGESHSWHTYPSIFALGHHAVQDLLLDDVSVEEKIDGSQFSFGVFFDESCIDAPGTTDPLNQATILRCRSKGSDIDIDHPEKMFKLAVDWCHVNMDKFTVGWTYRCEFLSKPKHNTLAYDRVPANNLIVYDINTGHEEYFNYLHKQDEATRIGLEVVPRFFHGKVTGAEQIKAMLDYGSILGGTKIEGVVIKNYLRFGQDKKVLMGKYVSEAFKEEHSNAWRKSNPTGGDIILQIGQQYSTGARWNKAVSHLRDAGLIEDSPKDIGFLIKEVPLDVLKEHSNDIADALFEWAWPKIRREMTRGLPQWYKAMLLDKQFESTTPESKALIYGGSEEANNGDSSKHSGDIAGGSGSGQPVPDSSGDDSLR